MYFGRSYVFLHAIYVILLIGIRFCLLLWLWLDWIHCKVWKIVFLFFYFFI